MWRECGYRGIAASKGPAASSGIRHPVKQMLGCVQFLELYPKEGFEDLQAFLPMAEHWAQDAGTISCDGLQESEFEAINCEF